MKKFLRKMKNPNSPLNISKIKIKILMINKIFKYKMTLELFHLRNN